MRPRVKTDDVAPDSYPAGQYRRRSRLRNRRYRGRVGWLRDRCCRRMGRPVKKPAPQGEGYAMWVLFSGNRVFKKKLGFWERKKLEDEKSAAEPAALLMSRMNGWVVG